MTKVRSSAKRKSHDGTASKPTSSGKLSTKEPVKLRAKKLASGGQSLYLDIYMAGNRSFEFLKMYLLPETNVETKRLNKETLKAANVIKAKRIYELTTGKEEEKPVKKERAPMLSDWVQTYYDERVKRGKSMGYSVRALLSVLHSYCGKNIRMDKIDKSFCKGYIDFLVKQGGPKGQLNTNTIKHYIAYLSAILNSAVREGLIEVNPFTQISAEDKVSVQRSLRHYLTMDEVRQLIETPLLKYPQIKAAYLFSCFCGLRISDIRRLTWGDIHFDGSQVQLQIIMKKTKAPIYLPLSEEAQRWLPDQKCTSPAELVFNLPEHDTLRTHLSAWANSAGITKHVTFHTARHTFATMMLTLGADLYTTSKLLGHSKVQTTQIYAKIVDQKKIDAVNLVHGLFDRLFSDFQ